MRKAILFLAVLSIVALSACSESQDSVGKTKSKTSPPTEKKSETAGGQAEQLQKGKIKVVAKTLYQTHGSLSTYANYGAKIKNVGNESIRITQAQVNFMNDQENIVTTEQYPQIAPKIIKPGKTAYLAVTAMFDKKKKADQVKKASLNIDFKKAIFKPNILKTKGTGFNGEKVVGKVINPLNKKMKGIKIGAGLYDADGKLIAVTFGDVSVALKSGASAGFQLGHPVPPENAKVKNIDVKAYCWKHK